MALYCEVGHDTTSQVRGTALATWPRYGRWACDTVSWGLATRLPCGHDTAPVRVWVHLGVLAGLAGCAHCSLVPFLDSILFLSHCLDTVHELCSPQNFFEIKFFEK